MRGSGPARGALNSTTLSPDGWWEESRQGKSGGPRGSFGGFSPEGSLRKIRATRRPRGTRSPPKNDSSSGRISWVNSYLAAPLEETGGVRESSTSPQGSPKPSGGVAQGCPKPTGGRRGTPAPAAAPASPGGPGGSGAAGHWGTAATPPRWCSHRTGGGVTDTPETPQNHPRTPKLCRPNLPGTPNPSSPPALPRHRQNPPRPPPETSPGTPWPPPTLTLSTCGPTRPPGRRSKIGRAHV